MEDQGGAQITAPTPTRQTHNGGAAVATTGGGREDCWSEGATAALIDAWGDRYLQLGRGNLRQKDWKEVADAVNARQDGVKPPRTDVQCKNRVDTLKKKYKVEKAKPVASKWPFYSRLDLLVGAAAASASAAKGAKAAPSQKAPAVTLTVKNLNSGFARNSPSPVVAAMMEGGGYSGGSSSKRSRSSGSCGDGGDGGVLFDGKRRMGVGDCSGDGGGEGFRELARAVLKFGEIYERIETSKQEQLMELERQRMEVMKDVEFQRMQMFMEAQIDLEKLKRPAKYSSGPGKKP